MPTPTGDPGGYAATRTRRHPRCWVCASDHAGGLAIDFRADATGTVEGVFPCGEEFTGYPGFLHGGVASALLDGAMTNCLMARGAPGLTARLEVRFRKPVLTGIPVTIRGWWEKTRGSLHLLGAELLQDGEVMVSATGRFMEYPNDSPPHLHAG